MSVSFANGEREKFLESSLKTAKNDSTKISILRELFARSKNVDTVKAHGYLREMERIVTAKSDNRLIADVYRLKAIILDEEANYTSAIQYCFSALELIKLYTDPYSEDLKASIEYELGNFFLNQSNVPSAMHYYFDALHHFERLEPHGSHSIPFVLNRISVAYYLSGNREQGKVYAVKSLDYAMKSKEERVIGYAKNQLANALLRDDYSLSRQTDAFAQAARLNSEAFAIGKKSQDWLLQGCCLSVDADLLRLQGKIPESIENSRTAIQYYRKINCNISITEELVDISTKYLTINDVPSARENLDAALLIATRMNNMVLEKDIVKLLAETCVKLNRHPEAASLYSRFAELSDSVRARESNIGAFVAEKEYEVNSLRDTLDVLSQENVDQKAIIHETQVNNWILASGSIFFFACVVLIFFYYRSNRQRMLMKNQIQQNRIAELEKEKHILAIETLLKGQEEERGRIARELHDSLSGTLSTIMHLLTTEDRFTRNASENNTGFRRAVNLLGSSIQEVRRIAHNMMPDAVLRFGLKEALLDYCESLSTKQTKIEFVPINLEPIDKKKEVQIYRIVQELIGNAIKHANATMILVQIVQQDGAISITVEDNGIGFDPSIIKTKRGAGWANIYNRAAFLNADVEIVSTPESGTTVMIETCNISEESKVAISETA